MSQCTTAAQCLKELARVMEQFGIDNVIDAINSKYIKYKGITWNEEFIPAFSTPEGWSFAIAEVEGKPVFIGDELYFDGRKQIVGVTKYLIDSEKWWSWNQPKPKTIMVELLVEDAEHLTLLYVNRLSETAKRIDIACRKALEREGAN